MPGKQHVVAVAAVIFKGDRVLAMRRAATKDAGAGLWETLSGRVQVAEEPLAAVQREIQEESGLEVRVDPRSVEVYAAYRGAAPMIVIVYAADYLGGDVVCSEEHDEYAWWTPNEFERNSSLARLAKSIRLAAALRNRAASNT